MSNKVCAIPVLGALLSISACHEGLDPQAEHQRALAQASSVEPNDPKLASLYKQSCKACHAVENSNAPLVRDRAAWEPRWKKGLPTLMQSVVSGFNGMPAGGQCFSCTAKDYEDLIEFLAGQN